MTATLRKNQYYIVSGLKRYQKIVKQDMLRARQKNKHPNAYIIARQKNKIYETLVSMVIHEGVEDTIQFALQLYAKLPHKPINIIETIKACECALESFFLLTSISPHVQELYTQQRPATLSNKQTTATEATTNPQIFPKIYKTLTEVHGSHSYSP